MQNPNTRPISLWPPANEVKATDLFLATDITDLTQSPSGTTKKYNQSQLLSFVLQNADNSNINSANVATVANLDAVYVNGVDDDGVGATLTNDGPFAPLVIDGIVLNVGDRVLVSFQTNSFENGVYNVTDTGSLSTNWVITRATDFDGSEQGLIKFGDFIGIVFGNINDLSFWFLTSASDPVVGTDPIVFEKQINVLADPWVNQATTPVTAAVNTGYTVSGGATLIDFTLPSICGVGSYVEITGNDIGKFTISQLANQQINFGTVQTTLGVGGSITADDQYCNIRFRCIVANDIWTVTSFTGSFTIV